jgi:hypothetical protein
MVRSSSREPRLILCKWGSRPSAKEGGERALLCKRVDRVPRIRGSALFAGSYPPFSLRSRPSWALLAMAPGLSAGFTGVIATADRETFCAALVAIAIRDAGRFSVSGGSGHGRRPGVCRTQVGARAGGDGPDELRARTPVGSVHGRQNARCRCLGISNRNGRALVTTRADD